MTIVKSVKFCIGVSESDVVYKDQLVRSMYDSNELKILLLYHIAMAIYNVLDNKY